MKNKLWLIAFAAVMGLTGCDDGSGPNSGNSPGGPKNIPVTGVKLDQGTLALNMGETAALTAAVVPEKATNKAVTWSTDDEGVATVAKGVVTGVAAGSAIITVTAADGGKTAVCYVDVNDPSLSVLTGVVTISPSEDVTIDTELTAEYSGEEAVSFQWKKDGSNIGAASTTNPNTYTPETAGKYRVTVSAEGYNSKTSAVVTVTGGAEHVHQWEWVVTTPATCTTEGVETGTCAHDGSTTTRPIPIDPDAHDWGNWEVTTPATYTTAGVETGTCSHDPTHTTTRPIPKLDYIASSIADLGTWLSSQTTNTASTPYSIKLDVDSLGGRYDTSRSLGYVLNANKTKYVSLDLSDSTFTSIENEAFSNSWGLTSVIIPDTVTSIGYRAFFNCTSLTSVIIPDTVTSIESEAFNACTSLTSITIGNANIGEGAFYNCYSLTSVTIGSGVTSIGGAAFFNCTSLTSVTIGSGVTSIGGSAFYNCTSLTSVTFEGSIASSGFDNNAFYNLGDLRAKYLAAEGGIGTYTRPSGSSVWTKED